MNSVSRARLIGFGMGVGFTFVGTFLLNKYNEHQKQQEMQQYALKVLVPYALEIYSSI